MSFWKDQQLNQEYQRRLQQQAQQRRQLQALKDDADQDRESRSFFWRKQAE